MVLQTETVQEELETGFGRKGALARMWLQPDGRVPSGFEDVRNVLQQRKTAPAAHLPPAHQIVVHGICGLASRAHGQNDGGGTGDDVTAGHTPLIEVLPVSSSASM